MAKARSLQKPGRKVAGKPGKARPPAQPKRPAAKRQPKIAVEAESRQPVSAAAVRRKAAVPAAHAAERKVELPATPPPLPAPIASFTF